MLIKLLSYQPEEEIAAKALKLWREGRVVDTKPLRRLNAPIGELSALNPAVVVFDCDRLPSRARELAAAMRISKSCRNIPLLFAGGTDDKLERAKAENRRAVFASWQDAPGALDGMLASPAEHDPADVAFRVPSYMPRSLAQKLGVPGKGEEPREIALLGQPDSFREMLGDLPETITFAPRIGDGSALAIVFVRTVTELEQAVSMLMALLPQGVSGWVVYPKRQHKPGFNENDVRDAALAVGLVDYKICSVSEDWSAMKFARRKA